MFGARLDPITTRSDWILPIEFKDSETGDLMDLTGVTFDVRLRENGGVTSTITGSSAGGEITNPDTGVALITFLASALTSLEAVEYDVALTMYRDSYTETIILGTIPVLDGIDA